MNMQNTSCKPATRNLVLDIRGLWMAYRLEVLFPFLLCSSAVLMGRLLRSQLFWRLCHLNIFFLPQGRLWPVLQQDTTSLQCCMVSRSLIGFLAYLVSKSNFIQHGQHPTGSFAWWTLSQRFKSDEKIREPRQSLWVQALPGGVHTQVWVCSHST